jgi:hypothetical protein
VGTLFFIDFFCLNIQICGRTFLNLYVAGKHLNITFMQIKTGITIAIIAVITSCASIPKETVTLSQALGNDLLVLRQAHSNIAELHFRKIKDDINSFVDDTYAPFVIQFVLNREFQAHQKGKPSIYTTLEIAGKNGGKAETEAAVKEMSDFLESAHKQIERKRNELLIPIASQEIEILGAIDRSYENAIYANSTITGYLQSVRKVKETQQEALSMIGLKGADDLITNGLVKFSEQVNEAVRKGKEIDVKGESAAQQLEEIATRLKQLTLKK